MSSHQRRLERRVRELEAQLAERPLPPKGVGIGPASPSAERADLSNARRATRRTTDAWALYLFEQVKDRSVDVREGLLDRVVREREARTPFAVRGNRSRREAGV